MAHTDGTVCFVLHVGVHAGWIQGTSSSGCSREWHLVIDVQLCSRPGVDVLVRQWGLSVVEVRMIVDDGEVQDETNPNSQRRLEVAGHSFPLTLADC